MNTSELDTAEQEKPVTPEPKVIQLKPRKLELPRPGIKLDLPPKPAPKVIIEESKSAILGTWQSPRKNGHKKLSVQLLDTERDLRRKAIFEARGWIRID